MGMTHEPTPLSDQELLEHALRLPDLAHGERSSLKCIREDFVRRGAMTRKHRDRVSQIILRRYRATTRVGTS